MNKHHQFTDSLLQVYTPGVRFLQKYTHEGNTGIGEFNVSSDFYCSGNEMQHLTSVQLQICINQLLFVFIAAIGKYDLAFSEHGYDPDFIIHFQNNNTFITRQSYYFHKRVSTKQPIICRMWLEKEKTISNLNILDVCFTFNDRECTGGVRVAIKKFMD